MFQRGRSTLDSDGRPSPGASPPPGNSGSGYESPGGGGTPTRTGSWEESVLGSEAVLSGIQWEACRDVCSLCQKKVGKRHMSRRHHCRLCGKCVCSACSPSTVEVGGKPQRVCTVCADDGQRLAAVQTAALSERLQALAEKQVAPEALVVEAAAPETEAPEVKAARRAEARAAREAARRQRLEEAQVGAVEIDFAQAQAERMRRRSVETEPSVGIGDNLLYAQPPAAPAHVHSKSAHSRSQGVEAIEAALGAPQNRIGSSDTLSVGTPRVEGPRLSEMQHVEPDGVSTSFVEPDVADKSCVRGEACKKACAVQ